MSKKKLKGTSKKITKKVVEEKEEKKLESNSLNLKKKAILPENKAGNNTLLPLAKISYYLGIASLFFFGMILGPVAMLLGEEALEITEVCMLDLKNEKMAKKAIFFGRIGTTIWLILILAYFIYLAV